MIGCNGDSNFKNPRVNCIYLKVQRNLCGWGTSVKNFLMKSIVKNPIPPFLSSTARKILPVVHQFMRVVNFLSLFPLSGFHQSHPFPLLLLQRSREHMCADILKQVWESGKKRFVLKCFPHLKPDLRVSAQMVTSKCHIYSDQTLWTISCEYNEGFPDQSPK